MASCAWIGGGSSTSSRAVEEVFAPQVLLEQIAEEAEVRNVSGLPIRRFYQAGEALRVSPTIARLLGKRSQARLQNQYGPSETHIVSSFALPLNLEESSGAIPIGRPIWNTQLYVLDEGLEPVPIGVAGELYIGGECLARGYLDRPGLTAERFIPNPFAVGERLYRTGDRARYLPDGNLEFLGRADDQVKIRGFRVEPGEIEAAIRSCPGVRHVAVVAKGEDSGNRKIVAYVVTDDHPFDPSVIRAELRKTLPDYMIPSAFVPLDAFPLTPSGKIDRKRLPDPQADNETRQLIPSRAGVPFENEVAQIWADVLQLPAVGIDDNFFELGGHSLLLMRVHSMLASRLGKSLPVTALFQYPTVRKLAAHIAQISGDTNTLHRAQARGALRRKLIQSWIVP
jgi:acyl-CoA synthetase (AMP-forming)/AMP-acid ligase II/acyl carrier protein